MYICAHKTLKIWRIEYLKEKYTTKWLNGREITRVAQLSL